MFLRISNGIYLSSLLTLVVRVVGAFAALFFQYLLASRIGAQGSGDYYIAVSLIMIFSSVSRLGLDRIIPKFVAIDLNDKNRKRLAERVIFNGLIILVVSLIVSFFCFLIAHLINSYEEYLISTQLVKVGSLFVVFISLNWYFSGVLIGAKRAIEASLVQTVFTPLAASLIFLLFFEQLGEYSAVLSFGIGNVIAFFLGLYFIKKLVNRVSIEVQSFRMKEAVNTIQMGLPLMVNMLATQLILYLPILVSGYFLTSEDTGVFAIVQRTSLTVMFVLFVSNVILAPRIAALWKANKRDSIGELGGMAAFIMSLVCLPILIPLLIFPDFILGIFGEEFKRGSLVLVILAISQLINVITSSIEQIMIMTGYQRSVMVTAIVCVACSFVLSIVLIPLMGIIGAAISFATTIVVLNAWRVYSFWISTQINVLPRLSMYLKPISIIKKLREY